MQKVFVFGNPDLEIDSLPLRILPELQKKLPEIQFEVKDPNEEWPVPEDIIILDTAIGIKEVTVFDSLEKFAAVPRLTMHDFDALTNLRFLKKLGKIKSVKVIALPAGLDKKATLSDIVGSVAAVISSLIIHP